MSSLDDAGLDPEARAAIAAAFAADPALREEVELIASLLPADRRARFISALARLCRHRVRPSAAVLGALEQAALGEGG